MRSVPLPLLILLTALLGLACSGDDDADAGPGQPDKNLTPDMKIVDDPFGRVCTNFNQPCKDKHPSGHTQYCISIAGTGKGYCTPMCTKLSGECFGAPNGQWAECIINGGNYDAGTIEYCAFMCKDTTGQTWACPYKHKCQPPSSQGYSLCSP